MKKYKYQAIFKDVVVKKENLTLVDIVHFVLDCSHSSSSLIKLEIETMPPDLDKPQFTAGTPQEVRYAIGQHNKFTHNLCMWAGPTPFCSAMMDDHSGRDMHSVVVRLNADGTEDIIYQWDEALMSWTAKTNVEI
jgi:hypothetical protein